jgi:hypothetical protein
MKHKEDCMMQNIAGENLLVPLGARVLDLNGLMTLNETAAFIWALLGQERTLDEVIAAVAERFEVPSAVARADIQTFLADITRLGLLEE